MIKKTACALLTTGLWAQLPLDPPLKSRDNNVWIGSGELLLISGCPDSPKAPAVLITATGKERQIPPVPSTLKRQGAKLAQVSTVHAPCGTLFGVTTFMVESGDPRQAPRKDFKIEVYGFDLSNWKWSEKPIGQLQSSVYFSPTVLSQDYLLGIAPSAKTFNADGRYHPFAVFRRDAQGTYRLDHLEDAGLGKPAINPDGTWAYPFMASLWLQSNPVWIRDLSVLMTGGGVFWSFGPKGHFHGMAKVYDGMKDAFLQRTLPWNGALVDYQPNSFGELVVSCLDPGAALQGSAMMPRPQEAKDVDSAIEGQDRSLNRILSKWHGIQWFKVKVPSGEKTRIPSPKNLPEIVGNAEDLMSFNWTFQSDGNIRMTTH